jgi:hypothetical protein
MRTVEMTTLFIGSVETPLGQRAGTVSGGNSLLMLSHRGTENNRF